MSTYTDTTDQALEAERGDYEKQIGDRDTTIAAKDKQIGELQAALAACEASKRHVLFGVNPGGYSTVSGAETQQQAWDRIKAAYGKIVSTRWWVSSFGWTWDQVPTRFGKCGLYVNLGADVAGVNAGRYDNQWATICKTAPNDRPLLAASFSHEPEDEVAKGQFTIAAWQAAQKRLGKINTDNGSPFIFAPLLMGVSYHPTRYVQAASGNQPWANWFNFDLTDITALGADIYQQGKTDATADTYATIGAQFLAACKAKGKLGIVGELGARRVNPPSVPGISDAARAKFITEFGKFANDNADVIKAVHYFESDNGRPEMVPWALTPNPKTGEFKSPLALAAYKSLIV